MLIGEIYRFNLLYTSAVQKSFYLISYLDKKIQFVIYTKGSDLAGKTKSQM